MSSGCDKNPLSPALSIQVHCNVLALLMEREIKFDYLVEIGHSAYSPRVKKLGCKFSWICLTQNIKNDT